MISARIRRMPKCWQFPLVHGGLWVRVRVRVRVRVSRVRVRVGVREPHLLPMPIGRRR
jgi:hypothetical protein